MKRLRSKVFKIWFVFLSEAIKAQKKLWKLEA